jgi:putative transposase
LLSGGQEADITYAEPSIEGQRFGAGIGDKGYDSDRLVKVIEDQGAEAVIPPKKNRNEPRAYDEHVSKERNKVERFINLMKQYRRVATRYEKTDPNFLGFIYVYAIMILVRVHGPRVTLVQQRRCGSMRADPATMGPKSTPQGTSVSSVRRSAGAA